MRETTIITIVPRWRPLLVLGILAAVAGVIAVLAPQISTLAVSLIIGALLLFDGVLQGIHAWSLRGGGSFVWRAGMAVLSLIVGAVLLLAPQVGIVALTIVVAIFFLLGGSLKLALAWQLRPVVGSGLLGFAGALSLLLGILIVFMMPAVAAWVLGLLVGVDLVIAGAWLITIALAARRQERLP